MKKTLLIAAAALAAGVISSQAQVYSQNIVGYVNQTFVGSGAYTLACAPLVGTNTSAETLLTSLQSGDGLFLWKGSGYYSVTYIGGNAGPSGENWIDDIGWTNAPSLTPGQGFFYTTGSGNQETNTYVGTVQLTNSIPLAGGGAYSLVSSTPPIAGLLDSTNFNLPLQSGDGVFLWKGSGYYSVTYIGGNAGPSGENWIDDIGWTNAPYCNVGQGFFYVTGSGSAGTWNQNLVIP